MKFSKSLLFFAIFIIWKENRPVNANVFYVYLPITRAESWRTANARVPLQNTQSPKIPKAKIPNVPKYQRLKQQYQLNN